MEIEHLAGLNGAARLGSDREDFAAAVEAQ
jgi:hypothetical protein